jgi:glycosyltransferase involved in cell wall biosynthesis
MEASMQSLAPLISIITPVYQAVDTLAATLNSLLAQEEWRWESLIVDDGSSDGSMAVAREFAAKDRRFRLLSQANAGACAARNTALAGARGRYVLFLDADDWMQPNSLGLMSRTCERKHSLAVHGGFCYARPDGSLTQWLSAYDGIEPLFEALSSSNVLSLPSCMMVRRSLLEEIGGFDVSLAHCGDWDLWSRVARSNCRVARIDECVTIYRMRPSSLSRNPLTLLRDARTVLTRIHGRDSRVSRPLRQYAGGASWRDFDERMAGFTLYAAAFAAMQGQSSAYETAMATIADWPALTPRRIAEFLLYAAAFQRCVGPDDLRPLPPDVRQIMRRIAGDLQTRSGIDELAADVDTALTEMGFGENHVVARVENRVRLARPRTASDTIASEYLRNLALRECLAG